MFTSLGGTGGLYNREMWQEHKSHGWRRGHGTSASYSLLSLDLEAHANVVATLLSVLEQLCFSWVRWLQIALNRSVSVHDQHPQVETNPESFVIQSQGRAELNMILYEAQKPACTCVLCSDVEKAQFRKTLLPDISIKLGPHHAIYKSNSHCIMATIPFCF